MKVVKVLQKGQIVIPKELRETIGLKVGQKVIVERMDESILIVPEPKNPLELMKGLLKKSAAQSAVATVRQMRKEWRRRAG